uniref:Uncharacterized protein n=1 Tax=Caenorhabditis japonica TaxID=281687 RepID=A0A8R1IPR3_CAEJA
MINHNDLFHDLPEGCEEDEDIDGDSVISLEIDMDDEQ